ncbi:MAG: peptidoglycan DD-metalloendopeptidase family protein [Anaerolineales bacterium]|nr:peptidoglycan DD-metalloendopeptidase family protein [Anaerolineales bacterium]
MNVFQKIKSRKKAEAEETPHVVSAADEPPTEPRQKTKKTDRFGLVSWALTLILVAALLGGTLYYKSVQEPVTVNVPAPTAAPTDEAGLAFDPSANATDSDSLFPTIYRDLEVKTNKPQRPRYTPELYRVVRGDSMYHIAEEFKVKSETILYVNEQLEDNPHSLRPGMELLIPPSDGLYYLWKEGDTFASVAKKFDANADDIIDFPGNDVDLADPQILAGQNIFIPGGSRELANWAAQLPTNTRGANTGTGGGNAANVCGGGPVANSLGWPADDHTLSGNVYEPGHLGIDISAYEGAPVYAAGAGVVTMAQGGWNYGYGNVIQIDHGNGYITVYAHLSAILVSQCQVVGQGSQIGLAGNTGNSFGSHLHFEIRIGGANVNPYTIVQ